jgi:hypothetical protein
MLPGLGHLVLQAQLDPLAGSRFQGNIELSQSSATRNKYSTIINTITKQRQS